MKINRRGFASVEAVLAIATGALVLMGLLNFVKENALPKTANLVDSLLRGEQLTAVERKPNELRPNGNVEEGGQTNEAAREIPDAAESLVDKINGGSEKILDLLGEVIESGIIPGDLEKILRRLGLLTIDKETHWNLRAHKNVEGIIADFPGYKPGDQEFIFTDEMLEEAEYKKHPQKENVFHNERDSFENTKWTRKKDGAPFGDVEIVVDSNGRLVNNPSLVGTYNFGNQTGDHITDDTIPFILWGNSADDTTTMLDRLLTAEQGVHAALRSFLMAQN